MKLHEIAIKNSGWVWDRLREARKHDFQIGEESLTDFVILNLKKYGKGKLVVDTFTRHKESVTGADWEWWFTGPSGKWLGMRVQAKVINLKKEAFEHLHYKNRHGHQVDTLIKDAAKNGLIPLYCMYTNWDPHKYTANSKCRSHNKSVRFFGTSIIKPVDVKKIRPTRDLKNIIKLMRPLQCIFCASGYGGTDLPTKALNYFKETNLISIENTGAIHSIEHLKDEPPYYVQQLLQGQMKSDIDDPQDEMRNDFDDLQDDNLKRVTVIREVI